MEIVFPLDDAYITLHNARVLLTGIDQNYDVSSLIGATSPAHLALIAALGLAIPLPAASLIVNLAAAVVYSAGLWRMALLVQPSLKVGTIIVILGILAGYTPYHLTNGLEAGLAMAAVTWAIVLGLEKSPALPLLCGVLPFVRPELAALSIALVAWRTWHQPRSLPRDLFFAALAAAPFLAWTCASTGHLAPLTASAKEAFFAESSMSAMTRMAALLLIILSSGIGALIIVTLFIPRVPASTPVRIFISTVLIAFFIKFPGGLTHNHFRYLYPLWPSALLFLSVYFHSRPRAMMPALGLVLLVGIFTLPSIFGGRDFTRNELAHVAQWTRNNLPSGSKILVHDAGYIAWATDFLLVDAVGLKTPSSIDAHRAWTEPSAGRDRHKAIAAIAGKHRPTHAVILNDPFWGKIAGDLAEGGWKLATLREPSERGYIVFKLSPPPNLVEQVDPLEK